MVGEWATREVLRGLICAGGATMRYSNFRSDSSVYTWKGQNFDLNIFKVLRLKMLELDVAYAECSCSTPECF
jgi:hypothetical protein